MIICDECGNPASKHYCYSGGHEGETYSPSENRDNGNQDLLAARAEMLLTPMERAEKYIKGVGSMKHTEVETALLDICNILWHEVQKLKEKENQ
jgi:hypothetical protein